MRSLLDGITSALRIPQQQQQPQQQQNEQPSQGPVGGTGVIVVPSYHQGSSTGAKVAGSLPVSSLYGGSNISCSFAAEKLPDLPFTMLLLTQNIGCICSGSDGGNGEEEVAGGGPEPANTTGISDAVRTRVADFLLELRLLIHEASCREFVLHIRKEKSNAEGGASSTADAGSPISEVPPLLDVIVVHFQEIGGKGVNTAFNAFFAEALKTLLPEAAWSSGLLMETNSDTQRFTALGSIVFLSSRMCPISSILSFRHRTFVAVADDPATYGSSPTFLFHGGKFSGAGSGRKGFLLTSLRFGTVVVNYLNVHLYHDSRNTDAAIASPSRYSVQRQEALLEAMAECMVFISPDDPLFIFGDFNARLDAHNLLKHLKETQQIDVKILVKEVQAPDRFWELFTELQNVGMIKKFDLELQRLMDVVAQQSGVELAEFPIRFPPTFPRLPERESAEGNQKQQGDVTGGSVEAGEYGVKDEDSKLGNERRKKTARREKGTTEAKSSIVLPRITAMPTRGYSRRRIPAWCDRVVWNPAGLELMTGQRSSSSSVSSALVKNDGITDSSPRYAYRSFVLAHTDHDCVALLF
ncbi:inositol-1,4,5-trisphosphate (IP3) 5-phosphatase, putative [Trypanosoma cruzi marinkellei]|uniref:inositol-polyphosphate 5-phosphatase n=1 Tax=Trypanosoma cruzi marinkellei TaxID=85056 RepID=K2NIR9_TRYCR|nr:inositol-1,4,5-trisphosphate (IP3) 5-phosphatase, putative [Trypanosoma cruzi marinkellei]